MDVLSARRYPLDRAGVGDMPRNAVGRPRETRRSRRRQKRRNNYYPIIVVAIIDYRACGCGVWEGRSSRDSKSNAGLPDGQVKRQTAPPRERRRGGKLATNRRVFALVQPESADANEKQTTIF